MAEAFVPGTHLVMREVLHDALWAHWPERVVADDGAPNDRLFALGPMTRGAFWEIVAVPDIRTQAWTLARRLSNAHWVAEGL